jgi:hypothetical protein
MSKKADKYIENAYEAMGKRNYGRAIKYLNSYLELKPDDKKAIYSLADAYAFEGDMKKAIGLYYEVAEHLRNKGFLMKSIAVCKRILHIEANNFNAKDLLQQLYRDKSMEGDTSSKFIQSSTDSKEAASTEAQSTFTGGDEVSVSGGQAISDQGGANGSLPYKETVRLPKGKDASGLEPPQAAKPLTDGFLSLSGDDLSTEGGKGPGFLQAAQSNLASAGKTGSNRTETQEIRILEAKDLLFDELSKEEYLRIIDGMGFHIFQSGDVIVKEGDPGDSMFIICDGTVDVYTKDKSGKDILLANLEEGNFFGEVSLLTTKPRTATIKAAERTELLELKKRNLPEIENHCPDIRRKLEDFYHKRTMHTVEMLIATRDL